MPALSQDQLDTVWKDGFIVVANAVTPDQLGRLRTQFAGCVQDSKTHDIDYGETLDTASASTWSRATARSARRCAGFSPPKRCPLLDLMRNGRTVDFVAELIGPNLKFHHGKVNSNNRVPRPRSSSTRISRFSR